MTITEKIKLIQRHIGVTADGIIGPKTADALLAALDISAPAATQWPTQAEVRSGKSVFGAAGESDLVNIVPPYPLTYEGKPVKSIRVHKLIAAPVAEALQKVLDHYGLEKIHALHLDRYAGSYAPRSTRGGSLPSMHAWGIALDFDAEHNGNNTHAPQAEFSKPVYSAWFDAWESVGAVSLGRVADRDYMHIQFARL